MGVLPESMNTYDEVIKLYAKKILIASTRVTRFRTTLPHINGNTKKSVTFRTIDHVVATELSLDDLVENS